MTRNLLFLYLTFISTFSFGQSSNFEIRDIGYSDTSAYNGYCGGMDHFELEIKEIRIRNNNIKLKGQLKNLMTKDIVIQYEIFVAEYDTLNQKLKINKLLVSRMKVEDIKESEIDGIFEFRTELKKTEKIYFECPGFGRLELKIK